MAWTLTIFCQGDQGLVDEIDFIGVAEKRKNPKSRGHIATQSVNIFQSEVDKIVLLQAKLEKVSEKSYGRILGNEETWRLWLWFSQSSCKKRKTLETH